MLNLSGTGDMVFGSENPDVADGFFSGVDGGGVLHTINASGLTGDLDLGFLVDLGVNGGDEFTFTSGTGVTALALGDSQDADDNGGAYGFPGSTFTFDFTNAAAASRMTIFGADVDANRNAPVFDGDLVIALGATAGKTIAIEGIVDVSNLESLAVTGVGGIIAINGVLDLRGIDDGNPATDDFDLSGIARITLAAGSAVLMDDDQYAEFIAGDAAGSDG